MDPPKTPTQGDFTKTPMQADFPRLASEAEKKLLKDARKVLTAVHLFKTLYVAPVSDFGTLCKVLLLY